MILFSNNNNIAPNPKFFGGGKPLFHTRLIVLLTLSLTILSCGKNILGPENIPPPTDFYIPSTIIPDYVDIKPILAPDNVVFGGFQSKFMYQGKWHMFVEHAYNYNPATKTLTDRNTGYNRTGALIRLDNEKDITIIAEDINGSGRHPLVEFMNNIQYLDNYSYIALSGSAHLTSNSEEYRFYLTDDKLATETDRGIISDGKENAYEIKLEYYYDEYSGHEHNYYYRDYSYQYRYSTDLINWESESEYFDGEAFLKLPHTFCGLFTTSSLVYFKGYYYLFGGIRDFEYDNPSGERPVDAPPYSPMETTYKRIKVENVRNADNIDNWEVIESPFGEIDFRTGLTTISSYRTSKDKQTLFLYDGGRRLQYVVNSDINKWELKGTWQAPRVLSTKDGINFKADTMANWDNAIAYNWFYDSHANSPAPVKIKKPQIAKNTETIPANWVKGINGFYYDIVNIYNISYNSYGENPHENLYNMPIPYDEIKIAARNGKTNFVITEEHKNSFNNIFASKVHPDSAKLEDWKQVKVNNYTGKNIHWTASPPFLLEYNNKVIRFVDYSSIKGFERELVKTDKIEKEYKIWFERGESGGTKNSDDIWGGYTQEQCYEMAMIYKYRLDMINEIIDTKPEDLYPDDVIRHYILEFGF